MSEAADPDCDEVQPDDAAPPPSPTGTLPPPRSRPLGRRLATVALTVLLAVALAGAGLMGARALRRPAAPSPSVIGPTPTGPAPSTTPVASVTPVGSMPDRPVGTLPDVRPPGFVDPPPGQGLDRYRQQAIVWQPCSVGETQAQCADIAVPLDYADPDGQAITLAVLRRPAAGDGSLGPLFVNPGGPGQPGRTTAAWLDAQSLPGYSLVGWDPRGTGDSTPVVCDPDIDALRAHDQSPDTVADMLELVDAWRAFGQSCAAGSGRLLEHIGSADSVADLDLLRQLLGGATLNYIGFSYGTYLGALYADAYPDQVHRLVLDSPVNITDDDSISQAAGFERAFRNFAQWCADQGCPLARSPDAVWADTAALLARLDAEPLVVGDRVLTQSLALDGIAFQLYGDASAYPQLADALHQAESGDGLALLQASDALWGRQADGSYPTWWAAFTAIRCLDQPDDGIAAAVAAWRDDAAVAPLFGQFGGPGIACTVWPVLARPPRNPTGAGAAPILEVGSTGDSATPFQYALWMAAQMPSAVLLTYDGPGHAAYGRRNACVDAVVNAYLNDGTVPAKGTTCP